MNRQIKKIAMKHWKYSYDYKPTFTNPFSALNNP